LIIEIKIEHRLKVMESLREGKRDDFEEEFK